LPGKEVAITLHVLARRNFFKALNIALLPLSA